MPGEDRDSRKTQLALALAQGVSVAMWSRANDVPKRTAYRWAADPKVRKVVEACRRRAIDRAVGQMTRHATWVVGGMTKLANNAASESARLSALRALMGDMMAVSKYSGLEGRMAAIEERLRRRRRKNGGAGACRSDSP